MRFTPSIRAAHVSETDAVVEFCGRLDPGDYVPLGWREWVRDCPDLSLVAETKGRIVGCVRAEIALAGCAFAQGLRIDPEFRRMGLATALMRELFSRLSAAGACRVLAVTGADNQAARRLHPALGLLEIAAITRRRHAAWRASALPAQALGEDAAAALAGRDGLVVSRPGLAHFRRIYFRAPGEWLRARARAGLLVTMSGAEWVLLDPPDAGGPWVAACGADAVEFAGVTDAGVRAPGLSPVTIEAVADPRIQDCLTRLGFEQPGPADSYVVLEAATPLRASGPGPRVSPGEPESA